MENLLLSASVRVKLLDVLDCGPVLVGCLLEQGALRASVAERCLSALSNLVSAEIAQGAQGQTISRLVQVGACEGAVAVLLAFGVEDVCTADAALFLLQSLAAQDSEALSRLRRSQCVPGNPPSVRLLSAAPPCDLGSEGVIALLLKVLAAHHHTSVTVTESAIGALGAIVLQDCAMMLHLLSNRGVPLLNDVLDTWAHASHSLGSKWLRVMIAVVEMLRRCHDELARVEAYYSPGLTSSPVQPQRVPFTSSSALTSRSASPFEAAPLEGLSVFEMDDDETAPIKEVDVGVPGVNPAFLYTVLDRVPVTAMLMDAENGVLEKELSQHHGAVARRRISMGAAGGIASIAMKVKSFKSRSSKSHGSTLTAKTAEGEAPAGPAESRPAPSLPKLSLAGAVAVVQAQSNPEKLGLSSSALNLKKVLERAAAARAGPESGDKLFDPRQSAAAAQLGIRGHGEGRSDHLYMRVLGLVETYGGCEVTVLHPAVRLLLLLCGHAAFPYHWVQLSNCGACAVLVRALGSSALRTSAGSAACAAVGVDPVYASEGALEALLQLAQCNLETRDKLRHLHAHTVVMDLLHQHGAASLVLCELAAQLFVHLYADVSAQEANEGNPRACRDIMQRLQQYGDQSPLFTEAGMCVLKTLTLYPPNRRLLGEKGGCAAIVSLIRAHSLDPQGLRSPKVALFGLAALSHLAGMEENQSRLAKCGACRLVVDLISHYGAGSELVAAEGLCAVTALGMCNRGMLGEVGACEVVTQLLRHYAPAGELHNDSMVLVVSTAVFNLCAQYPENKQRFLAQQIASDLRRILGIRQLSYSAREAAKDAVNAVCF